MPAGVSWSRYLKMLSASTLAMFAGAEVVHRYYRPDLFQNRNSLKRKKILEESSHSFRVILFLPVD
uniref:Uncharacterized protein n=1 Tax=Chrysemys picta bellii TaxID=8478 RepID=A0A8C3FYV4_CHRPI